MARTDGTLTPMIAVDELPSSFRIVGVPATITPAGTQSMISLGLKERSNQRYVVVPTKESPATETAKVLTATTATAPVGEGKGTVEEAKPAKVEQVRTGEDEGKVPQKANGEQDQGQQEKTPVEHKVDGPISQFVESWRKKVCDDGFANGSRRTATSSPQKAKDMDDETTSTGKVSKSSHESPPIDNLPSRAAYGGMGTKGTLGKKVYCTHWIRWGECDYTQQGCLYKHEMPDEAKLQEIGIATYPRWYRIANPEKFNGVIDGPEWHRRPGPAPTDQLWRGPPPARPVEPQTYEDFRSNARPAPTPVHRQPIGPPSNHTSGPVIFAFDPNANTFHSFGSFGNFRSSYIQQAPGQSFNRTPLPRVVTMQPPFVRQQRSGLSGRPANTNEHFSSDGAHDSVPAGGSGSTPSLAKVTEISEEASTDAQSAPSRQRSAATHVEPVPGTSKFSPAKTTLGRTIANGTGSAGQSLPTVPQGNSNNKHNTTHFNSTTADGNHKTANYGRQQSHSHHARGPQALNEAYQPLVPSPAPAQRAAVTANNAANTMGNHFVPAPETPPPTHKRYFVPLGQSQYAPNGDFGDRSKNTGNASNGGSRNKTNLLVDL